MGKEKNIKICIEELTEEEAKEVNKIFRRFIRKYKDNQEDTSYKWLVEQLHEELPEKDEMEIQSMADEIVHAIEEYDQDLEDLNRTCKTGRTKEGWMEERIQDCAKGVSINQMGDYLLQIDRALEDANAQMARVVMNNNQEISECVNLDGFIAEQYHVNNFNTKAILEKSPYRARVCVPEGEKYGRNSVDVMIDDIKKNQKGIARYQFKFGKDSKATIELLNRGEYSNQRIVVPKEQVESVQEAFPSKSVTDYIGGNDEIKIKSDPVTKEQMKNLQVDAQESQILPKVDWNSYTTKELTMNIGKQAGMSGVQAVFLGTGISIVHQAIQGEEIDTDEVVKTALTTGSDTCVKSAAGGALKVAAEKGLLPHLLPPGTAPATIAKIACVGIEDAKIFLKVAKGEVTMSEALDQMGKTSVAMWAGLSGTAIGMGIGANALSVIPIVGPVVGGLVGGMVGYMAGNGIGEKVYEGAKKIVKKGGEVVKKFGEKITEGIYSIKDFILS